MLDGQTVSIGDSVYVLGIGSGTVSSVSADGSFAVKLGNNGGNFRCLDGGYVGNVRKVFWHDPLILIPPKNLKLWTNLKKMAQQDYEQLMSFLRDGLVKTEQDVEHDSDEV